MNKIEPLRKGKFYSKQTGASNGAVNETSTVYYILTSKLSLYCDNYK